MAKAAMVVVKKQPGFVKAIFLSEYETGEYEWIFFWKTKEDAMRAYEDLSVPFYDMIGDHVLWNQPCSQLYEVYNVTSPKS